MASQDGYLRSNADKSESDPDNDLRLRSDADKQAAPPGAFVGLGKINGILLSNILYVNGIPMSSINAFNNLGVP